MNFQDAGKIATVIDTLRNAERRRSPNRAILDGYFNGDPPLTAEEAKTLGILINYNEKKGAQLLHVARNQYENAFGRNTNFFKVGIPSAPAELRSSWESTITRLINKPQKDCSSYYYTRDEVWGGVVLHGVGARTWWDKDDWEPEFTAIQDMLIPTDTDLSMKNLRFMAVRRNMKPGSLFKKAILPGELADKGWQKDKVLKILDEFKDLNTNPEGATWTDQPEKMTELFKQNGSYFDSDKAPTIHLWDFIWQEEENKDPKKNGWYRAIILDKDCTASLSEGSKTEFVYNSSEPFAQKLGEFIHFQFGDGNNVPPFKYHSIRSLAWLIYDLLWILNRLGCQFTQHVFEQMMLLFRVADPSDRDRVQKLVLQGLVGLLPEGLSMVPAGERYQVNTTLVQGLQANLKQSIGEASSQYTQNVDNGTSKERTAYEVQAVLSQASALMASMLGRAYRQEHYACCEIARRFARKNSTNFDVKKFRAAAVEEGVDEKYIDYERWVIEVEQVMGGGNRMLEIAEAKELMGSYTLFDPAAQQEIKHDYVLAVTNNPKKAERLAPLEAAPHVSDATHDAELSFATLMLGVDMEPQEGVNHQETIEALLRLMAGVIGRINATPEKMGTPQDLVGLQSVERYTLKHIGLLAQDERFKPLVKQYGDILSKLMNEVRAFGQRQQEAAAQQGQQGDPEVMAKIQADMLELKAKLAAKEAADRQKLEHNQMKFEQQQAHATARTASDINLATNRAISDAHAQGIRAGADLAIAQAEADAQPEEVPA